MILHNCTSVGCCGRQAHFFASHPIVRTYNPIIFLVLGFVLFRLENAQFTSANGIVNASDDIDDAFAPSGGMDHSMMGDAQPWKNDVKPQLPPPSQMMQQMQQMQAPSQMQQQMAHQMGQTQLPQQQQVQIKEEKPDM